MQLYIISSRCFKSSKIFSLKTK